MRPADLNLLRPRPDIPWLAWLLLALGAGLCLLVGLHYQQLDAALEQTRLSAEKPRPAGPPLHPDAPLPGDAAQPPWGVLLTRLEAVQRNEIALLSLDASPQGHAMLTAEAADADAMLAYLQQLRAQPGFASASLLSHVTQEEQPGAPLRFSIRLPWKNL